MMRIALAQINATVGDLKGNAKKVTEYIQLAKAKGADIVAFPELVICGYPPEDLLLKEHFVDENIWTLKEIAKETRSITAIIGFVDKDKNKNLYNAAAVVTDGRLKGIYHKEKLPNYGVFDEKRYFAPGEKNKTFSVGGRKIGISICEDIWREDGPHRAQAKKGAKILINISSSPYHAGKIRDREEMLSLRAKKTKAFIFYVNLVGGQDELVFDGASMVLDPKGKVIACGKQFEEDLVLADLDLGLPSPNPALSRRLNKEEEIYQALVLGTRDYVHKNGFKKVIIGLSGGIDSSIVAAIAVDALGKENVVGISMPSRFTSPGTKSDARILAQNLGIKFLEIPIEGVFGSYLEIFNKEFIGQKPDTTEENIQARIRGNILMAFSNKFGWLVLTTGNKSEVAVGYCTLYGDMAGGFGVIKDVSKTQIYALTRFYNQKQKSDVIPQSVLDRAPTAELRENQTDQDTLPAYAVLDDILKDYVELNKSFTQINSKIKNNETVAKVIGMVDRNEYKRRQATPGIKITPRAFGRDRRLPITNKYKEF